MKSSHFIENFAVNSIGTNSIVDFAENYTEAKGLSRLAFGHYNIGGTCAEWIPPLMPVRQRLAQQL